MNEKLASAKNWYVRNERRILITTSVVGIAGTVLMRTGIAQHNQFLKDKGLYEEFYTLFED